MLRPSSKAREATGSVWSSCSSEEKAAAKRGNCSSWPVGSKTTVGPDISRTLPRIKDSKAVNSGSTSRLIQPTASAARVKSSYSARRTGAEARVVINSGMARGWPANAARYDLAQALRPSSHESLRSGRESMFADTMARTSSMIAARLGTWLYREVGFTPSFAAIRLTLAPSEPSRSMRSRAVRAIRSRLSSG